MPRAARRKSESGIYHIMLRGINKQNVFEDAEDQKRFLQVLNQCREKSGFQLLAYCLMSNHLHLLIKEGKEELEQIFKRIGVRYVYWYNLNHDRSGHLFQDRFRSEPVEDDRYFLTVLRYIHQNPVKAGLCRSVSEYKWSSYHDYLSDTGITDTEFGLSLFQEDKEKAKTLFRSFMNEDEKISCLDLEQKKRISDREAKDMINRLCGRQGADGLQGMKPQMRDNCIAILKENGLSLRQIARLTGISFGMVRKK